MSVGPGDFVKLTYHGRDIVHRDRLGNVLEVVRDEEKPLNLAWDSRVYTCEVGKEAFVPFEAMWLAFGDPRSGSNVASIRDAAGNVMFVSDRATEVRRLRSLYDNQFGDETEILYAPEADITDLEGEEIITVLKDPFGEHTTPIVQTPYDRDQLLAQLKRQQQMIETLAQAQGIDLGDPATSTEPAPEEPTDPFADVPADTGTSK
jgi:hypothetical protein